MHIHLINLDRSSERLAEFCNVNRHLTSVSRFAAIEGSALNPDDLARRGLITKDILARDFFTPGALGCAVSHLALWDRAIANNRTVTISEDDAIFNQHFELRAEEVLKTLPADWDLIYWGFNFDLFLCFDMLHGVSPCVATFNQEQMRAAVAAFQKQSTAPRAFRVIWAFGALCYSISPKGAQVIKSKILPLRPKIFQLPEAKGVPPYSPAWRMVGIDNCINTVHREISSYVCFPPLVVSKNEAPTSMTRNSAPEPNSPSNG